MQEVEVISDPCLGPMALHIVMPCSNRVFEIYISNILNASFTNLNVFYNL